MSEPNISFKYGNILHANDKKPWADVLPVPDMKSNEVFTPEKFARLLEIGRQAIAAVHVTMEEVVALRLSTDTDLEGRGSQTVLTPEGWDSKNTGILENPSYLIDPFRDYWKVIEGLYVPRVRLMSGKVMGGAWLTLGKE